MKKILEFFSLRTFSLLLFILTLVSLLVFGTYPGASSWWDSPFRTLFCIAGVFWAWDKFSIAMFEYARIDYSTGSKTMWLREHDEAHNCTIGANLLMGIGILIALACGRIPTLHGIDIPIFVASVFVLFLALPIFAWWRINEADPS